jgi:hypothetical protein
MRRVAPIVAPTLLVLSACALLGGCGDKVKYKPEPAYSGAKANIPKPPAIPAPNTYKDASGSWTIYGLQHQLNNPKHRAEVEGKPATIAGYVVDIYRPKEPAGKEGCIYPQKRAVPTSKEPTPKGVVCDTVRYQPPHFWIADNKDEKNPAKMVIVEGYASSFIQQYMAKDWYKDGSKKIDSTKEDDLYLDNNYSSHITILGEPKMGSKVVVTGQFGSKYEEGQGGRFTTPFGILDVTSHKKGKIDYKEGGEEIMEPK